ncbi:TorF family putative porin [Pseudothauera rhizosphaerae]|uniref:Porin n=1 Tax=Pseudothauera rhizosphaerae TaxID=2565932 RepID=A0A4S4AQM1_9RHOO|nr:TorF family putative porin [Pseudothauera rhizosphaerae]THF61987.1 porin [Pseudothauera rhizosphaerae]
MQKRILASALAAALLGSGAALAEDSPFSANVSVVSDYAFRGISQTDQRPALQGGFDYAHDSGFYVGFWASNVSWLSDLEKGLDVNSSSSLETNLYAGYATELGPIGVDVGLLQYYYPGDFDSEWKAATGSKSPNTLEAYVGLSWEFLSFTYSHTLSSHQFGVEDAKNSGYYDLGVAYEILDGLTLDAHYGYSDTRNADNYEDWKLGATYSYGGFDFGLHYVDTDIKDNRLADDRFILSVSRSF